MIIYRLNKAYHPDTIILTPHSTSTSLRGSTTQSIRYSNIIFLLHLSLFSPLSAVCSLQLSLISLWTASSSSPPPSSSLSSVLHWLLFLSPPLALSLLSFCLCLLLCVVVYSSPSARCISFDSTNSLPAVFKTVQILNLDSSSFSLDLCSFLAFSLIRLMDLDHRNFCYVIVLSPRKKTKEEQHLQTVCRDVSPLSSFIPSVNIFITSLWSQSLVYAHI